MVQKCGISAAVFGVCERELFFRVLSDEIDFTASVGDNAKKMARGTGLPSVYFDQVGMVDVPGGLGVLFYGLSSSVGDGWMNFKDLSRQEVDVKVLVRAAHRELQRDIVSSTVVRHLLTKEYTLTELQDAIETVLGESFDKRNFRKKLLTQKVLAKTKGKRADGKMRPAALYKFSSQKVVAADMV